jgi:hypothetical protein
MRKGCEVSEKDGEPSKLFLEVDKENSLAKSYLNESDAKNLYALYQKRNAQLEQFAGTIGTISELYAGKSAPNPASDTAIQSMERVALAAIDLAKTTMNKERA